MRIGSDRVVEFHDGLPPQFGLRTLGKPARMVNSRPSRLPGPPFLGCAQKTIFLRIRTNIDASADLAARLDLDLAVDDVARQLTRAPYDEFARHAQGAVEAARDLCIVDVGASCE